jgi:hypothetical protein
MSSTPEPPTKSVTQPLQATPQSTVSAVRGNSVNTPGLLSSGTPNHTATVQVSAVRRGQSGASFATSEQQMPVATIGGERLNSRGNSVISKDDLIRQATEEMDNGVTMSVGKYVQVEAARLLSVVSANVTTTIEGDVAKIRVSGLVVSEVNLHNAAQFVKLRCIYKLSTNANISGSDNALYDAIGGNRLPVSQLNPFMFTRSAIEEALEIRVVTAGTSVVAFVKARDFDAKSYIDGTTEQALINQIYDTMFVNAIISMMNVAVTSNSEALLVDTTSDISSRFAVLNRQALERLLTGN